VRRQHGRNQVIATGDDNKVVVTMSAMVTYGQFAWYEPLLTCIDVQDVVKWCFDG